MSSLQTNVVDLVNDDSSAIKVSHSNSKNKAKQRMSPLMQRRRSARIGNQWKERDDNNGNINSANNDEGACEIIELDADTPPPPATISNRQNSRQKRLRLHSKDLKNRSTDDCVEILEILSPPAAAVGRHHQPSIDKAPIDRIREVFPTVSRSKVEKFITMAMTYSSAEDLDDENVVHTILTILADDPTGNSINAGHFAAAAVGGHLPSEVSMEPGRKVAQLECQCCFAEYNFEDMVSCRREGHLFCKTCLQKHTEQRVFGLGNFGVKSNSARDSNPSCAFEILCMHSSGCMSGFHERQLRRILPEKVMKKYDELQCMAVVEKAGMSDASKCPKCHYIAFGEASVVTFNCPKCNFKSCRKCGEEDHQGIHCDQVETKHETNGRKVVEEAMTNAKIRTCPRYVT